MAILRKKNKTDEIDQAQLRSIKFNREKVDRQGKAWKKADFWLRKDYLNKLKVIAHFEDVSVGELINRALGEYVAREYDKSRAMEKLVAKKPKKVKV